MSVDSFPETHDVSELFLRYHHYCNETQSSENAEKHEVFVPMPSSIQEAMADADYLIELTWSDAFFDKILNVAHVLQEFDVFDVKSQPKTSFSWMFLLSKNLYEILKICKCFHRSQTNEFIQESYLKKYRGYVAAVKYVIRENLRKENESDENLNQRVNPSETAINIMATHNYHISVM